MARMTGGEALVSALASHHVDTAFGIPGTHNLEMYRHLRQYGVRHIGFRHEQGAGYAADGYSRIAGKPGVILATSGPGILNAATALANAYADSVPLLAAVPGPPLGMDGRDRGWMHELKNQRMALDFIVERAVRCESSQAIVEAVHDAFARWTVARPRPVVIEIPVDVLDTEGSVDDLEAWALPEPAEPPNRLLREVAAALNSAASPVLVAGGGAAGAYEAIRKLSRIAQIPVLETMQGKGTLPAGDPLCVGPVLNTESARALIRDSDLVLFVGTELSDAELGGRPLECSGLVVRIDVSPAQVHKNIRSDLPIVGDARRIVEQLVTMTSDASNTDGARRARTARQNAHAEIGSFTHPHRWFHEALCDVLSGDDIVTGDSSQVTYQGSVHLWPSTQPNRLIAPSSFATLGYSLPAAIGCLLADSGKRVVAVVGDGALMFSVQELRTAADLSISLPVVVVDNGGYAEIAEEMDALGIARTAVDLIGPEYDLLAGAMGCAYAYADSRSSLSSSLRVALSKGGPTLIHVRYHESG